jgi:transcriptional regulator with XRE-family HTH domain
MAAHTAQLTSQSNQTPDSSLLSDEYRQQLGQRLRELRQSKGWSADTVAVKVLGLGPKRHAAVTRIERGETKVRPDQLEKLAAAYEKPLAELLQPENLGSPKAPASLETSAVDETLDQVSTEGEDQRHDREGWTSTRAHAPRFIGRR